MNNNTLLSADLSAELTTLHEYIEQFIANTETADRQLQPAESDKTTDSRLNRLCRSLGLSPFERNILLLCLGMEFDQHFPDLYARAQGNSQCAYPTLNLATRLFDNPVSISGPSAPLQYWQLIETGKSDSGSIYRPLRLTDWTLSYLTGRTAVDYWLSALIQPIQVLEPVLNNEQALADRIIKHWDSQKFSPRQPVQLSGLDSATKQQIAALAAKHYQVPAYQLDLIDLINSQYDLDNYRRLLEREILICQGVYYIICDRLQSEATIYTQPVKLMLEKLLQHVPNHCILAATRPLKQFNISLRILSVKAPVAAERTELWNVLLQKEQMAFPLDSISPLNRFNLNRQQITSILHDVMAEDNDEINFAQQLRLHCREQAYQSLATFAQWIEPKVTWQDLVLPDKQLEVLQNIVQQYTCRRQVLQEWGFADKTGRDLAVTALFHGPSGTGKSMAAEVIANALQLDLLRVNLSQIVDKHLGETEKNLEKIFAAAEQDNVLLLFDEADALFSRRLTLNESRDRYANIGTSYLLQRLETFTGLAILTTNFKQMFDKAFLRRLRFRVEFPLPEPKEKLKLWQKAFPAVVPQKPLDYGRLSKLPLTGGQVHNIALNAAFKAAGENKPVAMEMLLALAKEELSKANMPAEILQHLDI